MDHGGGDEGQGVLTQGQGVALADYDAATGIIGAEELVHHAEGLGRGHDGGLGVGVHEHINVGGVVGLHVLDHQEIGAAAVKLCSELAQPLLAEVLIHGVHDGNLLVQDDVGIVGHAVGDHILALEQVHLMVVDADVADVIGNKHLGIPPRF